MHQQKQKQQPKPKTTEKHTLKQYIDESIVGCSKNNYDALPLKEHSFKFFGHQKRILSSFHFQIGYIYINCWLRKNLIYTAPLLYKIFVLDIVDNKLCIVVVVVVADVQGQ